MLLSTIRPPRIVIHDQVGHLYYFRYNQISIHHFFVPIFLNRKLEFLLLPICVNHQDVILYQAGGKNAIANHIKWAAKRPPIRYFRYFPDLTTPTARARRRTRIWIRIRSPPFLRPHHRVEQGPDGPEKAGDKEDCQHRDH